MVGQRRRDTAPEVAIRRILHAHGCRYRVDYRIPETRRRADIAFTRRRVAVFVDGCFWHSCPIHGSIPKQNTTWWEWKLRANSLRDRDTDRLLRDAGWSVIRVWEHEDPQQAAERILRILDTVRASTAKAD
jgi:DNA mismatch endonuclease (patch repair protein)